MNARSLTPLFGFLAVCLALLTLSWPVAAQAEVVAAIGAMCGILIAALVIFILLAVWVYRDAEKRGKSGVLWLVVVLLTGIIGLIVWLIVRPKETVQQQK